MKSYISLPIVAVAAVLAFSPTVQAYDELCDVQVIQDDRVVLREDPWPVRAGRTIVRTPVILGETLAGRREIIPRERPAVIAERIEYDRRFDEPEMFRSNGRTLLGRGACEELELFDD